MSAGSSVIDSSGMIAEAPEVRGDAVGGGGGVGDLEDRLDDGREGTAGGTAECRFGFEVKSVLSLSEEARGATESALRDDERDGMVGALAVDESESRDC